MSLQSDIAINAAAAAAAAAASCQLMQQHPAKVFCTGWATQCGTGYYRPEMIHPPVLVKKNNKSQQSIHKTFRLFDSSAV
jgi:hypothetical protein